MAVAWATFSPADTIRGIYVNQRTVENPQRLATIIGRSTSVGINTFIIDLHSVTASYRQGIEAIHDAGIDFTVRVVVFPHGANSEQIRDRSIWKKRLANAKKAIALGATEVQLDYIRYSSRQPPSARNADDVLQVVSWFKTRLERRGIPLQIAVFGQASFAPVQTIGQNLPLLAQKVDSISPMLYPSHFFPFDVHSENPYRTVLQSLLGLKKQFGSAIPVSVVPYVEVYNFRFPMSDRERRDYIADQIRATTDFGADGFIAWSVGNKYDFLFEALDDH